MTLKSIVLIPTLRRLISALYRSRVKHAVVVLLALSACLEGSDELELSETSDEIINASQSSTGRESVLIQWESGAVCTGLVLSKHWLATAGHCAVAGSGRVQITMRHSDGTDEVVYLGAAWEYVHPSFVPSSRDYNDDMALIRLDGIGMWQYTTARIYTNSPAVWDSNGEPVTIWGWGIGSESSSHITCAQAEGGAVAGETIRLKRRAWLDTRSDSTWVRARMTQRKDAQGETIEMCGGDSGAPVFLWIDNQPYAYAIYTGNPTGIAEGPSLAAKISWIVVTANATPTPLTCRMYNVNGQSYRRCFEP